MEMGSSKRSSEANEVCCRCPVSCGVSLEEGKTWTRLTEERWKRHRGKKISPGQPQSPGTDPALSSEEPAPQSPRSQTSAPRTGDNRCPLKPLGLCNSVMGIVADEQASLALPINNWLLCSNARSVKREVITDSSSQRGALNSLRTPASAAVLSLAP